MQRAAIILCGGKSTRMGRDKASLPFGAEKMLQRMVRLLSEVVPRDHIVVVAAAGQSLPSIPEDVEVVFDERPERGPLEGLLAGLQAVPSDTVAAYITSCDVPLLLPAFVQRMFDYLGDYDLVAPREGEQFHPLAGVYRPQVAIHAKKLLSNNRLRLRHLFEELDSRRIDVNELRDCDPQLLSLMNLNHLEDYQQALKLAGFPVRPDW